MNFDFWLPSRKFITNILQPENVYDGRLTAGRFLVCVLECNILIIVDIFNILLFMLQSFQVACFHGTVISGSINSLMPGGNKKVTYT